MYGLIILLIGIYFIVHFFITMREIFTHMRNNFFWYDFMPIILGIILCVLGLGKLL